MNVWGTLDCLVAFRNAIRDRILDDMGPHLVVITLAFRPWS